jgi:hypothetical protein
MTCRGLTRARTRRLGDQSPAPASHGAGSESTQNKAATPPAAARAEGACRRLPRGPREILRVSAAHQPARWTFRRPRGRDRSRRVARSLVSRARLATRRDPGLLEVASPHASGAQPAARPGCRPPRRGAAGTHGGTPTHGPRRPPQPSATATTAGAAKASPQAARLAAGETRRSPAPVAGAGQRKTTRPGQGHPPGRARALLGRRLSRDARVARGRDGGRTER